MRIARTSLAVLATCLAFAGMAQAQPSTKVRIDAVRIGFPIRAEMEAYKGGTWAPVYVDVTAGGERIDNGEADLIIETTDVDDMQNTFTVRLPALDAKEQRTVMTYVRPGYQGADSNLSIVSKKDGRVYAKHKHQTRADAMAPYGVLYLTAGSPLAGFKRVLSAEQAVIKKQQQQQLAPGEVDNVEIDTGSQRVASVNSVELLPTRWFGYSAVDVLFLTTGSEGFVKDLLEDRQNRKEALVEWIRRGGRIVISAGRNQQFVAQLLEKMRIIDCAITGSVQAAELGSFVPNDWANQSLKPGGAAAIEVAKLEPGPAVEVILRGKADNKSMPLVVQVPSGLGRVLLVAFDLDVQPFTGWLGSKPFWAKLRSTVDPLADQTRNELDNNQRNRGGFGGDSNEMVTKLYNTLEQFPDVPVVSFGWVALFILLYIIVVGPLDYLFLKKVVKRLELTWITFPAVVIVVSTLAYFTAYYLKGNDMRINKIDVVDIDLQSSQVYGSTWFTIFSPRIQHYTIGIEPASPTWTTPPTKENDYSAEVTWLGRLDNSGNAGIPRGNSAGLFRRTYDYAPDAAGLTGVPIQVWALKSFTASWQAPLPTGADALVTADFKASAGSPPSGTLTSHLPGKLTDVVLLFGGNAYAQKDLNPGDTLEFGAKDGEFDRGNNLQTWFGQPFTAKRRQAAPSGNYGGTPTEDVNSYMKSLMFHGAETVTSASKLNSSLRQLDQGWRVLKKKENLSEIILCGRMTTMEGAAEKVAEDGVSASRLWLFKLPQGTGKPPALTGTLSQDTYVRIYIPVKR